MNDDIVQEEEIPFEEDDYHDDDIDIIDEETPEEGPDFDKDEMIPTDD